MQTTLLAGAFLLCMLLAARSAIAFRRIDELHTERQWHATQLQDLCEREQVLRARVAALEARLNSMPERTP